MDKKILIDLVKKEAQKLKLNATKQEIANLNFSTFVPSFKDDCIYGQMTGNCYTKRASNLILKCCENIFAKTPLQDMLDVKIDGRPTKKKMSDRDYKYYSPIEIFISFGENRENGNNKMLIDYLKGKRKKLAFKKF